MKLLLVGLTILASSSVFACPNLAGSYSQCQSVRGIIDLPDEITLSQYVRGTNQVYEMISKYPEDSNAEISEIVIDGKTIVTTETDYFGNPIKISQTHKCLNNYLVATTSRLNISTGEIQKITFKIKKARNQLIQDMSTSFQGETESDRLTCFLK
jgi:hypothetical protein